MHKCEMRGICAFYSGTVKNVPGPSAYMKAKYCHKRSAACARLKNHDFVPVSDIDNYLTPFGQIGSAKLFGQSKQGFLPFMMSTWL